MNKNVIITGATRGIGRAIAKKLVEDGYTVHVVARSAEELAETATALPGIHTHQLDLSDRAAVKVFTAGWTEPLYGLVNNAGVFTVNGKDAEHLDDPDTTLFDTIMGVNLQGLFFLTHGLLPRLEDNGRIVNIASQLATAGRAGMGAYCASKHAVLGLTRSWALELGGRGITVNAVSPAWTKTESNLRDIDRWATEQGKTPEQVMKELAAPLPLKRFTEPSEVAEVVAFLVSEQASGVTGQDYAIK